MSKYFCKIFLIFSVIIICSCGVQRFRKVHLDLMRKGNENCEKHLKKRHIQIIDSIFHRESIMLLENNDNSWSEISLKRTNRKYRIPKKYSHYYRLKQNDWIDYEFSLFSNDKCNCEIENYSDSYVFKKLLIYEYVIADTVKMSYIEELGKSNFDSSFKLVIFGKEDFVENLVVTTNEVKIPKTALDWKFKKYSFLLTSNKNREKPLIYFNKTIVIDINNQKVLGKIEPMLK